MFANRFNYNYPIMKTMQSFSLLRKNKGKKLGTYLQRIKSEAAEIEKSDEAYISLYFENSFYMNKAEFYIYLKPYRCTIMSKMISLIMESIERQYKEMLW